MCHKGTLETINGPAYEQEGGSQYTTVWLLLVWKDRESRDKFKDPEHADPDLGHPVTSLYGGAFWQKEIAGRL